MRYKSMDSESIWIPFLLLITSLLLQSDILSAQTPTNDNCSGATFIYLDQTGNTCINDSNMLATADGQSNTCDAGVVAPLPPGGHDVWYSYVVTGTVNTITVTPIGSNPAQKVSLTVINGNCSGGISTNVCNTAATSVDPASLAFTSFAGTQVWFYVTSLEADGEFLVCISSTNGFINPDLDCNNATRLCNTYDFSSPGSTQPGISVTPSCFNSPPVRPFWYKFTVGYNGPLEFTGFPTNIGGFRWALFDVTTGCPGVEVACNSVYDPFLPFGMSTSVSNCSGSPYCPPVNVISGSTYALMVDDTSQNGSGFDFTWGYGVRMLPTADFTVDSLEACGELTADFSENSEYTPSTIWSFDFGDSNPPISGVGANLNLPSHYYGPGTYLASLTLTEISGCSHTFSRQIIVKPKPAISLTVNDDSLCFDGVNAVSASFSASSSSSSLAYDWTFPGNNGVLITGPGTATASWNTPGTFVAGLQVTENGCASDTARDTVYIFDLPASDFTLPDSGCTGTDAGVSYTGGAGSQASYTWNYAGGTLTNQTAQQFDISWANPGVYTLSLTVSENGCSGPAFSDSIRIFDTPVIAIQTPLQVCEGETLNVAPLATGAPAGSVFTWDFGNATFNGGSPNDGSSGNFSWNIPGITYMTAQALSPEGCLSAKDSISITVNTRPDATFSVSDTTLCGADTCILNYSGSAPLIGSNFTWDFGGGNLLNATNPWGPLEINFPAPGIFPLYLVVDDNVCLSDTLRDTVLVASYPVSNAGIDLNTCAGQSILIGSAPQAGYQYTWAPASFLNTPTLSNPQANVPYNGTIDTTVQFVLSTSQGFCTRNDTMQLTVHPVQQAFFIPPDPQCADGNSFDFNPYYGLVTGAVLTWIIGNDTLSGGQVQNYTFTTAGTQNITLQTQTPGCPADQHTAAVVVKPNPVVNFSVNLNSGCVPLDVSFQDLSPVLPGAGYLWNFDDGIVSFQNNPVHTYSTDGSFYPTLTITSADTCSGTDTLTSGILVFPAPLALFTAQPLVATDLNPLFHFDAMHPNTNCYFDFGDGSGDSSCSTSH
ncbi:MAG: hypothetical protein JNL88_11045, partial [Bacteroidia bacterium]|nr:hypothetical protein [Bacteroidia bacterium]